MTAAQVKYVATWACFDSFYQGRHDHVCGFRKDLRIGFRNICLGPLMFFQCSKGSGFLWFRHKMSKLVGLAVNTPRQDSVNGRPHLVGGRA